MPTAMYYHSLSLQVYFLQLSQCNLLRPEPYILGGGNYITLSANADVNSLEVGKWYFKGSGTSLTNFSFSGAYLFWTSYNISGTPSTFKHQYAYSLTDSAVYHRSAWGGGWTDWSRDDTFGCSTPADLATLLGGAMFLTYDNVPENPTNELDDIRGIKVINWNSISPYKGTSLILSFNGSFLPGFYERGVQIRFYNQNIASNPTTVKYRVRWGNSGWGEWSDI